MSLYGNVKRIASSTFQFDRIYNTRKEMEESCTTDGVYAGRYVLVDYGLRYKDSGNVNENNEPVIIEDPNYTERIQTDQRAFGDVFDSTVWQKIYSNGESGEKYIMIAELNGQAPKIELITENPLIYKNTADADLVDSGEVDNDGNPIMIQETIPESQKQVYVIEDTQQSSSQAIKLEDTYEKLKQPYFDLVHNNELSYYLHLPKPINLDVNNDNINYNEKGFDPVYSMPQDLDDKNSYIVWAPDGLESTDIQQGEIKESDTKRLYMNLPQFGNLMQTLFDLVYGVPNNNDTSHVRPFFKPYWTQAGNVGATIEDPNSGVPRTYYNDDKQWLNNGDIPDIGRLLANNTEGLAGILSGLFTERDPLSGTVRYYFQTDWGSDFNYDSNAPFISNKPDIIGYKYTSLTTDENNPNNTIQVENISDCDYIIDYTSWQLHASLANLPKDDDNEENNTNEDEPGD